MLDSISEFLLGQKVASVCCLDDGGSPYCFSCFIAFDEARDLLYFKSKPDTQHMAFLEGWPEISGTVHQDKLNSLALKGVQFTGCLLDAADPLCVDADAVYHHKYPFAMAMRGQVRAIHLHWVKMTDNTLGFGKKITWHAGEVLEEPVSI